LPHNQGDIDEQRKETKKDFIVNNGQTICEMAKCRIEFTIFEM